MALYVSTPLRKARSGGIKSVVGDFVLEDRLAAAPEGIVYDLLGCGLPKPTRAGCYDTVVASAEKERGGVSVGESIAPPFAAYSGVECYLGGDQDGAGTYLQQARDLLEQGEEHPVEENLWAWAENATLTSTAGDLVGALASVEEAADGGYVGQPLILMSRYSATLLLAAGAIVREGGQLLTATGSPVLATSSVDPGVVAAVGWPTVYASPVISAQAPLLAENLDAAIAERVFSIAVDCDFRATSTVTPVTP